MNAPEPIKKKSKSIKYETISFRLNVEEKKYVHDVINRIKEIDKIMNNKIAFMFMVGLFDEFILHNDFNKEILKQMFEKFRFDETINFIRQYYSHNKLSDNDCIYLIEVNDTFLCTHNPTFIDGVIKFKPLKDFPVECESCLDRR